MESGVRGVGVGLVVCRRLVEISSCVVEVGLPSVALVGAFLAKVFCESVGGRRSLSGLEVGDLNFLGLKAGDAFC